MYAGTTFRRSSGKFVGVHQKIDRVARRHLDKRISKSLGFPKILDILHFEGNNGPDGMKRKGSSKDEPVHFIDPTEPADRALIHMINNHITNLSHALSSGNNVRASFEAAWLAHAIVDGLTPAHHYPLNDQIKKLWVRTLHKRLSTRNKDIINEISRQDEILKKWEYWGTGGVVKHVVFEGGVASIITTDTFKTSGPTDDDVAGLVRDGFEMTFIKSLRKIYDLHMYDEFSKNGWTWNLAATTRKILVPEIIKAVTLAWYQAVILAEKIKK